MTRTDILLDESDDLMIVNGDFSFGESNDQHIALIFDCNKGELRENPSIGYAAPHYLKTNKPTVEYKRELRVELNKDGYADAEITVNKTLGVLDIKVE